MMLQIAAMNSGPDSRADFRETRELSRAAGYCQLQVEWTFAASIWKMDGNFKLSKDAVATAQADSKRAVLEALTTRLADAYGLDPSAIQEGLEERERLGSTGFGRRVAIPHARIDGIDRPVAAMLKLDSAVDFDAADGMPVDLVIGLLSPTNAGAGHLHALAAISRMVRDEATYDALSRAADSEALFATLTNLVDSSITNDNVNGAKCESA